MQYDVDVRRSMLDIVHIDVTEFSINLRWGIIFINWKDDELLRGIKMLFEMLTPASLHFEREEVDQR